MSKVYFTPVTNKAIAGEVRAITKDLLKKIILDEKVELNGYLPMKVHFGEKGNVTFIKPENYDGIIDYLQERGIQTAFMETSVMYGGQRYKRELHEKIAEAHQSGQWHAAIERERSDVIPQDLQKALRRKKGAIAAYRDMNDSRKKQLLHWLFTARRAETRKRRIEEIVRDVSK